MARRMKIVVAPICVSSRTSGALPDYPVNDRAVSTDARTLAAMRSASDHCRAMPILVLLAGPARAACVDVPISSARPSERSSTRAWRVRLADRSNGSLRRSASRLTRSTACARGSIRRSSPDLIAEGAMASLGGSRRPPSSRVPRCESRRPRPVDGRVRIGPSRRVGIGRRARGREKGPGGTRPAAGRAIPVARRDRRHLPPPTPRTGSISCRSGPTTSLHGGPSSSCRPARPSSCACPDLPPPAAPPPIEAATTTRPEEPRSARRTALLAGGVACLVAGGAFAFAAEGKDDDIAMPATPTSSTPHIAASSNSAPSPTGSSALAPPASSSRSAW